ncbi:hypothetical protein [Ornithinimicrobium sp. Y1694]|uniref:hypothetical protein n=1 Tax=Ornithinimicrobium sp. Y1694 TaxID=3418590 RepID=UPI003CE75227
MRVRERGASTLEYLGVVIVAVLLIGGLLVGAGGWGTQVRDAMDRAICRVTSEMGGDCGGPGGSGQPISFAPRECTVSTSSETHEGGVNIVFVDLGGGRTGSVQEIQLADGTTRFEVAISGEVEGGVSVNPNIRTGPEGQPGVGAGIEAGISGSRSTTATYHAATLEEAQALLDSRGDGGQLLSESVTWGGEVTFSADAGLAIPVGSVDVDGVGANFDFAGGHSYETITHADGTTTTLTTIAGEVGGGIDSLSGGAELGGERGGAVAITRDANGQITQIQLVQTGQFGGSGHLGGSGSHSNGVGVGGDASFGGDSVTITTTTLQVTDDNRATVEAWMGSADMNYAGIGKPWDVMWGGPADTASNDPFQNLLHQEAEILQVQMDTTTAEQTVGGQWSFGPANMFRLGGEYVHTTVNGELVAAEYFDAPSAGQRPRVVADVCHR